MRAPRKEKAMHQDLLDLKRNLGLFSQLAKTIYQTIEKNGRLEDSDSELDEYLGIHLDFVAALPNPICLSQSLGDIGKRFAELERANTALTDAMAAYARLEAKGVLLERQKILDYSELLFAADNGKRRIELHVSINPRCFDVTIFIFDGGRDQDIHLHIDPRSCSTNGTFAPDSGLEKLFGCMAPNPKDRGNEFPKKRWPKLLDNMADFYLTGQAPEPTKRGTKKS